MAHLRTKYHCTYGNQPPSASRDSLAALRLRTEVESSQAQVNAWNAILETTREVTVSEMVQTPPQVPPDQLVHEEPPVCSEGCRETFMEGLNDEQRSAFDHVIDGVTADTQTLLFVNGGPGTGKSFLASRIVDFLKTRGQNCIASSFMWSAVFMLNVSCPKMSLHALLHASPKTLQIKKLIEENKWHNVLQVRATVTGMAVLVIDELSTLQVSHLMLYCGFL